MCNGKGKLLRAFYGREQLSISNSTSKKWSNLVFRDNIISKINLVELRRDNLLMVQRTLRDLKNSFKLDSGEAYIEDHLIDFKLKYEKILTENKGTFERASEIITLLYDLNNRYTALLNKLSKLLKTISEVSEGFVNYSPKMRELISKMKESAKKNTWVELQKHRGITPTPDSGKRAKRFTFFNTQSKTLGLPSENSYSGSPSSKRSSRSRRRSGSRRTIHVVRKVKTVVTIKDWFFKHVRCSPNAQNVSFFRIFL